MDNISKLAKEKCTGCLLCESICPKKCITVSSDELGFVYPKVDSSTCVECGLCARSCPEISLMGKSLPNNTIAALWDCPEELVGCSSGGISSLLAKSVIENHGIYYGAVSSENCKIVYTRITCSDDIKLAKGSKYVQSNLNVVYNNIRDDLKSHEVLFVGSPCQCAAVSRFCSGLEENLILVSFPCGGWTSTKILQSEVKIHLGDSTCEKVVMRNRRKVSMDIYKNGKLVSSCIPNNSFFMTALDYKLSVRYSCWNCTYSCPERIGDIVLGDFWGYQKNGLFNTIELNSGISFVGSMTKKGQQLIERILPAIKYEAVEYDEIREKNPRLNSKVISDKNFSSDARKKFEFEYAKTDLKQAVIKVAAKEHYIRKIRGFLKYTVLKNGC